MEANIPTVVEELGQHRKHPEVEAQLALVWQRVVEALTPVAEFCAMMRTEISAQMSLFSQVVAESPPSLGYEPWLMEQGWNLTAARLTAYFVRHSGERKAQDRARQAGVVRAIKFLAVPGRRKKAVIVRVKTLLTAWQETSVFETLFEQAGFDDMEYGRTLEVASRGEEVAVRRLVEMSAQIAPYLPQHRGRKVTLESATHETFLRVAVTPIKPTAYTYDWVSEQFTDPVTQATEKEFGRTAFDPRPACRRIKDRKK